MIQISALIAFVAGVFIATRWLVNQLMPQSVRRWAWVPIAAVLIVFPFADELYNEQQTRLECARDGGFTIGKTISAQSREEGIALIETRKLDSDQEHFWKHELLFVYRPTEEELARLRWFVRKHGWLQGNAPGSSYFGIFTSSACPDPLPYLAGGAARSRLVKARVAPVQD